MNRLFKLLQAAEAGAEAAAAMAAELKVARRKEMIDQLLQMGLSEAQSSHAVEATGATNADAALNWHFSQ